jgi:hypothetical protein
MLASTQMLCNLTNLLSKNRVSMWMTKENFTMRSQHILEFTNTIISTASPQLNQKTAILWRSYVKVGSDDLTALVMKGTIFWDTTPCTPLKVKLAITDYTALFPRRQYSSSYVKIHSGQYLAPNSSSLYLPSWFLEWVFKTQMSDSHLSTSVTYALLAPKLLEFRMGDPRLKTKKDRTGQQCRLSPHSDNRLRRRVTHSSLHSLRRILFNFIYVAGLCLSPM